MPSFDDFLKEDLELIISLPYRVGMFVARADNDRDTLRDEQREEKALIAVLESLGDNRRACPFLAEVADESLSHRAAWAGWRAKKGLAEDIARSLRLMKGRLPEESVTQFRKGLFHIGCVVAQAYGESAPQRGEALMSELMTRLSDRFFDPLEKNPENISAAEKAALQKLKDALKG